MNEKVFRRMVEAGEMVDPYAKYPRPDLDHSSYLDEHRAYQAYYDASIAIPYSSKECSDRFDEWYRLWKQFRKCDQALVLLTRIAERFPPGSFLDDESDCLFCGWVEYETEDHDRDCIAVLIQEFRVDE